MDYVALKSEGFVGVRPTINLLYDNLIKDTVNYELYKEKFTIGKSLKYRRPSAASFFAIFKNKRTDKLILISNYGEDIHNIISAENIGNKEKCKIVVTGCQTDSKTDGKVLSQIKLLDENFKYINKTISDSKDALKLKTFI